MKIKYLYIEITRCPQCPYCQDDQVEFGEQTCTHPNEKVDFSTSSITVPSHCLLPDFRLDTEDDSSE